MRRNGVSLSSEKAAHRALLASIARGLRERHDAAQPLPERLADLARKIDQATGDRNGAREAGKVGLLGSG